MLGLILLAPLHFDLEGEYAESLSFQGRVRWAGGLFNFAMIRREGTFHWALDVKDYASEFSLSSLFKKKPSPPKLQPI